MQIPQLGRVRAAAGDPQRAPLLVDKHPARIRLVALPQGGQPRVDRRNLGDHAVDFLFGQADPVAAGALPAHLIDGLTLGLHGGARLVPAGLGARGDPGAQLVLWGLLARVVALVTALRGRGERRARRIAQLGE